MLRGVRGAITVKKNSKAEIVSATVRLLRKMVSTNRIKITDIAALIFSSTPDLNAEFPARAAARLKWEEVPRLCAAEINVPGSLKKCVRILMLVNTNKAQKQIHHIYLNGAEVLKA